MINVKQLQNIYFVSNDVVSTATFYERVFGMKTKFADGERWTQFDVFGRNFSIGTPEEGVSHQSGAVPVFEIENMTDIEQVVREHGGQVVAQRNMGGHGFVTTIHDPAGNAVQLFCRNGR